MIGDQHAYALVRDWLGEQPRVDRELALRELARRYLLGHGPADERDLARWSGLPLREVRAGLRAIAPRLTERPDGLLDLAGRRTPAALPPPRLLGAFDPLLFGWCSREAILGTHRAVVTVNGIFRPFALVRGHAVATWTMAGGDGSDHLQCRAFCPAERRRSGDAKRKEVPTGAGRPRSAARVRIRTSDRTGRR